MPGARLYAPSRARRPGPGAAVRRLVDAPMAASSVMTPSRISATRSWSEDELTALQGVGRAARWIDVCPPGTPGRPSAKPAKVRAPRIIAPDARASTAKAELSDG